MFKQRSTKRKLLLSLLAVSIIQSTIPILSIQKVAAEVAPTTQIQQKSPAAVLTLREETPITSGAKLKTYDWRTTHNNQELLTNIYVVEVDLNNPLVKLDTMAGVNNQFTKRQSIKGMAAETGAVAGVNGDFYNMMAEGVPIGPHISNGELLATPIPLEGFYSFAIDNENRPVIDLFSFEGEIRAADGATYPLGGINKTYFWYEPSGEHSMINGLYMYTNTWGQEVRSNDGVTVPTEVMVRNGVITEIAPNGVINEIAPEDGYILRASGEAAAFVMNHMKVGDPLIADHQIVSQDPGKVYDASLFKTMIGGGTILVEDGQLAELSRKKDADVASFRSRTAVGYSEDRRYVYLVTAERSAATGSAGMTIKGLQELMIQLGSWKALNLDGGGSTQLVSRPLGDFEVELTNRPEDSSARRVVNGIGVYSLAPQGNAMGIFIDGDTRLFINERASYQLKGYDQYYNPLVISDQIAEWSVADDTAVVEGDELVMKKAGTTTLTAKIGEAIQSIEVSAIGRMDLASMQIFPSTKVVDNGVQISMQVMTKLVDGTMKLLPNELIDWEWRGFEGSLDENNVLSIDQLQNQHLIQIVAQYDGFRTMVSLPVGNRYVWADFDQKTPNFSFQSYPKEVKGEVALIASLPERTATDRALYLGYDFSEGTGTKAAYASFGENGILLEGIPQSIRMEVLGDKSHNWLRAEVVDANQQTHLVQLGQQTIDWSGWKTIDTDLSKLDMAYPITLKRIYVASPEQGQAERAQIGAIAVDNITILTTGTQLQGEKSVVTLEIDNPTMKVNDETITIDQAPVIVSDFTMVPVRFVVEALGGEIEWDEINRKVTVLKDQHLIDMWLDQDHVVMDGVSVVSSVAPTLMNGRTMVPLRLLSEKLGWEVAWNDEARTVTLQ